MDKNPRRLFSSRVASTLAATCLALPIPAQEKQADPPSAPPPVLEFELANSRKITFSGELRWRAEKRENYDFNDKAGSNPFFVGQRARLGIEFTVNDNVKAFLQLADVRQFGEETSTVDRSADGQDLHQGYLAWQIDDDLHLKLGRQEVELGDQRLVSSLNWLDQGRSLDGVVAACDIGPNSTLIGFATLINNDVLTSDNTGAWVNGVYWTSHNDSGLEGDLYGIVLLNEETPANGTEHRWTLGGRVRQELESGFFGGLEVAGQVGEINNADIPFGDTYGAHAEVGFQVQDHEWKPRFMLEVNAASGNDPNTADNERFNTLLPFSHAYFGQMDFALWENIVHVAAHAQIQPGAKTKVKLAWHYFQTMESADRFGGPANTLSAGVANGRDEIGNEIDLTCRHPLGDGIWGEAGASIFLPGGGVKDAGGFDDEALFFYYMMGIKI